MSFGGLANCPLCWDAPEICKCPQSEIDAYYKTSETIRNHRNRVANYMACIAQMIKLRGEEHDVSKLSPVEFPVYSRAIGEFEKYSFGSDGYEKAKESIKQATDHHYKLNRHHIEYFSDGIDGMNLIDLIELLCDWKSATLNHPENPGDMARSLQVATEKYKISPQLARVLYNTIQDCNLS